MGGKVDTSKDQWWQKHNASNMVEVHSMDEFLGELKRCGEGKLVIVDFLRPVVRCVQSVAPEAVQDRRGQLRGRRGDQD
jgi:hypothetical protein